MIRPTGVSLKVLAATVAALGLAACGEAPEPPAATEAPPAASAPVAAETPPAVPSDPLKTALFGAVHVHTGYSFDAFTNGTVNRPDDAYNWAKGRAITGNRGGLQIRTDIPLDFYAVSDHAEMMGVFAQMANPNSPLSKLPIAARVTSSDPNEAMQAFAEILREMSAGKRDPALTDPVISASVWSDIVATADEHYEPGVFTTFPAFEWSANPNKRNLHRVVVFGDTKVVPELAFSALDSDRPEDLWNWMEEQRTAGSTLLAIPHNANASDGLMFSLQDSAGNPLSETYIAARRANEPLYEISQIKGTSETHPDLSPNDEFGGFELWDYTLSADSERPTERRGSYARAALLDGIALSAQGQSNPFQYGFIGDTDTHNAAASNEEYNYTGKFASETVALERLEGLPGQPPAQAQQVREFSSGGLAGVWAEQNTRESIFAAMQRRETFGTSGPRIRVRFFGGWNLGSTNLDDPEWIAAAYAGGVPMGGELTAPTTAQAPAFVVWAAKDPRSGNLDRVQIVKGWVDADGTQQEKIFDVAWSEGRAPDAGGALPAVGSTVEGADYGNTIGAAELRTVWTDPDFDAAEHAFYYARVLEIPTPRWSTRDAVALGKPVPEGLPETIQERAWSSPIWYQP